MLKGGLRHCHSHKQRVLPRGAKSLHRYLSFSTLNGADFIIVVNFFLSSFANSMLARIDKKDFPERAKRMRVAAQAPQNLKLKALAIIVPALTEDDEETYSGPFFKRKRKTIVTPTEHYESAWACFFQPCPTAKPDATTRHDGGARE